MSQACSSADGMSQAGSSPSPSLSHLLGQWGVIWNLPLAVQEITTQTEKVKRLKK